MSQMGAQANIGGLNPTSTQAGTPRPTNSSNQGQTTSNGKPSPAQVAQLQHELFQMTLNDFMNRRGTPITQTPVINRKKINLFVLDILGRKIGGPQVVLKHIQMLNQKLNADHGVELHLSEVGIPNIAKRRQSSAAGQTPSQQPETPARITPHESNGHVKPNTIKKYVPIKKESSAYNDWVLKSVSDLGDEIELTKPVYLFAPELGSLNIHALVMSLKNYTRCNPGEASSALNTLLVTTTDPNFAFSLTDAPELLDALVGLGQKILDQITTFEKSSSDYVEVRSQVSDAIESTFGKYVDGK
ncbi:hypothetical protein HF325_004296 [Metschnikowia pulcherrima]|uniref:ARID domain-containing protein n=1 Tax=Metschnikowia pulcherrima TaxID=27326 RepID=A0A8H7GRI8_9ASCO|nr:hypothetical protein HF325_004296 [Metschnikowia pulcherrima]